MLGTWLCTNFSPLATGGDFPHTSRSKQHMQGGKDVLQNKNTNSREIEALNLAAIKSST